MDNTLGVCESFYSLQGEGPTMGRPSVFLRLAGCNLMCGGRGTEKDGKLHNGATWRCDSIEVFMKGFMLPFDDILNAECLKALQWGSSLIITGGEPLLQQKNIMEYIMYLSDNLGGTIPNTEIETNGTIMPDLWLLHRVRFNCSPKLSNSGMSKELRYNVEVLKMLNNASTCFKFVVSNEVDFKEIELDFLPFIDRDKVWLMPAGSSQDELARTRELVAELAKKYYLNFSDRLHINIWNKKTGV